MASLSKTTGVSLTQRHPLLPIIKRLLHIYCFVGLSCCTLIASAFNGPAGLSTRLNSTPEGQQLYRLYLQARNNPAATKEQLIDYEAKNPQNRPLLHALYLQLAYCRLYFQSEDLENYKPHIQKIIALSDKYKAPWIKGFAYYWQARFGHITHSSDIVESNLAQLSAIAEHINIPLFTAMTLDLRANIESLKGDNHLAIADYLKAYTLFEEQGDIGSVARIVSNLATLYLYTGEFEEALKYSAIAENMENDITPVNYRQLTIIFNNRAYVLGKQGRHQEELAAMITATQYSKKVGSRRLEAAMSINISDTYNQFEQYSQAVEMATQGIAIAKTIESHYLVAVGQSNLGAALSKLGNHQEGLKNIQDALAYFESEKLEPVAVETLEMLAEAYGDAKDYKNAFMWHLKYHERFTKMQFDLRQEKIINIQEKFEAEKKQKEISILKKDNQLQTALVDQREWQRNVGIVIVIMVIVILSLLFNRYRLSRHLNLRLEQSNLKLYDQSHKDSLTGLFNRRYIKTYIDHVLPSGDRNIASTHYYIVLLVDIDFFKDVNDTYGHHIGDAILVELSQRLQQINRKDDIVARWGGEEFIIIAEHNNDHHQHKVASRILETVKGSPFTTSVGDINITVSIGYCKVSSSQALKEHWDKYTRLADKALYQAKENGRDQCVSAKDISYGA